MRQYSHLVVALICCHFFLKSALICCHFFFKSALIVLSIAKKNKCNYRETYYKRLLPLELFRDFFLKNDGQYSNTHELTSLYRFIRPRLYDGCRELRVTLRLKTQSMGLSELVSTCSLETFNTIPLS